MTILNQPLILVIEGPEARELLAAIGEAIRDGRAIVVPGEEVPPSRPGIVRALPASPSAVTLRRVG